MSWFKKNMFLLFLPDGGEKPLQFVLNFFLLILSKTKKVQNIIVRDFNFDNTY